MSAPVSELYQELILDHNRRPRNCGRLDHPDHCAVGHNPLCGDRVTIELRVADGVIQDVRFEGAGCAISTASASLMTEAVKGRPVAEARALFERFHRLVTTGADGGDLGKLAAFAGVERFPIRVKCATLAWHTLLAALDAQKDVVTTE
jgi:nitrogen fixation NifU-like protein